MMKSFCYMFFLLVIPFRVSACTAHDRAYFSVHPKVLQETIAKCPAEAPKLVSCEELHQIAIRVNEYVYALRMSPQGYGKSILALQETIVSQSAHSALKVQYENNLQELRERLAIVSWLESPGGSS